MDFLKILRSLEEFLYEVMSWLAFYPRTLFRILLHPIAVSKYTVLQMAEERDQQFTETISPPLMLILSIILAHAVEMAYAEPLRFTHSQINDMVFGSQQGLLAFRSVCFSLYALIAALWTMKRTRQPLTRDTLRVPFYVHAFLASPFVIFMSLASMMVRTERLPMVLAGAGLGLAIAVWYVRAQAVVFRYFTKFGALRSYAYAVAHFVLTTVLIFAIAFVMLGFGQLPG